MTQKMNLVKKTIQFETSALLESMVKVSEVQKDRITSLTKIPNIYDWTVVFSMGRQCGHTSAIVGYGHSHPEEKILVVTKGYPSNLSQNTILFSPTFRSRCPHNTEKYDRVFFDNVSVSAAYDFLSESREVDPIHAKSIVIVSPKKE